MPDKPLITFTISRVVIPAISGVPVPGAKAGSKTSISIDIDVLDPAFAPGTGTPEIAGMTTREMVNVLRGLAGLNLISADVVEVSPAYDHAEVTSLAAATIVYELTNLFAKVKR